MEFRARSCMDETLNLSSNLPMGCSPYPILREKLSLSLSLYRREGIEARDHVKKFLVDGILAKAVEAPVQFLR